jgi:peroxiredoxin
MQRELGDKGLTIVGASLDDTSDVVKEFQNDIKQEYTVLVGDGTEKQKFVGGIAGLPTTYIIDRDGNIREKLIGPRDREGFEAIIKPLLDEPTTKAQMQFIHQRISEETPLAN